MTPDDSDVVTWDIEMHELSRPLGEPYGHVARIGLLALSTDLAIERDFAQMAPDPDVAVFTTRIHLETPNSDRTFLALQREIVGAMKLIIPDSRLDAVVFGCTSASTIIGPSRVAELVAKIRPGTACTNPATGTIEALSALDARNIAVITPYTRQMTGNIARFIDSAGFRMTSVRSLGYDTDVAIGSVPADSFIEAARQSRLDGADAIFVSCTATKALNIIDELEAETGLPVVVSNQAAFWHALRLVGWSRPIAGYGMLLRSVWGRGRE